MNLSECAFLASLPKAPANYHSKKDRSKAIVRRNWILKRLFEEKAITEVEAQNAQKMPLEIHESKGGYVPTYATEEIKRTLKDVFSENDLANKGLSIYTSIDPKWQKTVEDVLRLGLIAYDRRHGYRGVLHQLPATEPAYLLVSLKNYLKKSSQLPESFKKRIAVVKAINGNGAAQIVFSNGKEVALNYTERQWDTFGENEDAPELFHVKGKKALPSNKPIVDLTVGAIVFVRQKSDIYILDQIPAVTGGLIIMDAETGSIIAMSGGFSASITHYNSATQAKRQPGSVFKPFVYAAALEHGYTPETLIDDSPIAINLGKKLGMYSPKNYTSKSLGPAPMHLGLEQSRNRMTVRLAHDIGMKPIQSLALRTGAMQNMPLLLSMSLGAGETTLQELTGAYASFVNGGKKITPHLITRVHDRKGHLLFHTPAPFEDNVFWNASAKTEQIKTTDMRSTVLDPAHAGAIQNMLRGAVSHGTSKRLSYLRDLYDLDIGGKTGTTNDYKDGWFIGFVRFPSGKTWLIGTFVGFPSATSLGQGESGGKVAVPIAELLIHAIMGREIKDIT